MTRRNQPESPLYGVGPFAHYGLRQLAALAPAVEVVNVPAGRTLVHQGRLIRGVFVIASGRVDVVRDGRVIGSVGAGTCVGGAELAARALVWPASIDSATDVDVVELTTRGFIAALDRLPGLADRMTPLVVSSDTPARSKIRSAAL